MSSPIRVLLAKVGLDGHDRGVKFVAATLRDDGHVTSSYYAGLQLQHAGESFHTGTIQEDVDVLGVSLLSGVQAHRVSRSCFSCSEDRGGQRHHRHPRGGVMPAKTSLAIRRYGGALEVLLARTHAAREPRDGSSRPLTRLVAERGPR